MHAARSRALLVVIAAVAMVGAGCSSDDAKTSSAAGSKEQVVSAQVAEDATFSDGTVEQAHERASTGKVLLVDVREDAEFAAGHAPEAVHVPLGRVEQELDSIAEQADDRPVWFICRSDRRSAEAAQIAVDSGRFAQVVNVDGGMGAWIDAGLPVEPEGGQVI